MPRSLESVATLAYRKINIQQEEEDITEKKIIEQNIEDTLKYSMKLYYHARAAEKHQIDTRYIEMLKSIEEYCKLSHDSLKSNEYILNNSHNLCYPVSKRVGKVMNLGVIPLIKFEEVKQAWNNMMEFQTWKAIFAFGGSLFTLLFGEFTILTWTLFIVSIIHMIFRQAASTEENYISLWKNFQKFLFVYLWLALANALSFVVTINGLPDGTFLGACILWIIYSEYQGAIACAEAAGVTVPPIFKKILKNKDSEVPF